MSKDFKDLLTILGIIAVIYLLIMKYKQIETVANTKNKAKSYVSLWNGLFA